MQNQGPNRAHEHMELRAFDHKVWPINNTKFCIQFLQISISLFHHISFYPMILYLICFIWVSRLSKYCSTFDIRVDFEIA